MNYMPRLVVQISLAILTNLFVGLFSAHALLAQDTPPAFVAGTVVSETGEPMMFANVQIPKTIDGAASDIDGRFLFKTHQTGLQTIQATVIGFEPALKQVTLTPGDTTFVDLVLKETLITLLLPAPMQQAMLKRLRCNLWKS